MRTELVDISWPLIEKEVIIMKKMYESCSYTIHESDLEMAKNLASELGLKLNVKEHGRLLDHAFTMDEKHAYSLCYVIWLDAFEVNSWEEGHEFEDDVWWKQLQERSNNTYLMILLNS